MIALAATDPSVSEVDAIGGALVEIASTLASVRGGVETSLRRRSVGRLDAPWAAAAGRDGPLRLNLGAGLTVVPGWLALDLQGGDLPWDLTSGIPAGDGTCSHVYCSHVLEHLLYPDQVDALLSECRRVLEPGGFLRVVVPDVRQVLEAYVARDRVALEELWEWRDVAPETESLELVLHYIGARSGEEMEVFDVHRFGFDAELLVSCLHRAGFVEVDQVSYMEGSDPGILLDDRSPIARRGDGRFSLFVEARCPGRPPPSQI